MTAVHPHPDVLAPPPAQRRLRLRFTKAGKVRFTSHRDVARMWERALRRSRLPVAYSQGFVPHPLVSFGLALPTGCESRGEYLDVRLGPPAPEETSLADLAAVLSPLLPEGVDVTAAGVVPEAEGSLQQEVASCDWELEVDGVPGEEFGGAGRDDARCVRAHRPARTQGSPGRGRRPPSHPDSVRDQPQRTTLGGAGHAPTRHSPI